MSKPLMRSFRRLMLLSAVLGIVVACGGPTPTPQVLVVTSTFTPEPVVLVVTATFTSTPEVLPSDTPLPAPTATAPPVPTQTAPPAPTETPPPPIPSPQPSVAPDEELVLEFAPYEHPSGAFRVDLPTGVEYTEVQEGVYLAADGFQLIVVHTALDFPLSPFMLRAAMPIILERALVDEGLISSFDDVEVESNGDTDAFAASFNVVFEDLSAGEGRIVLWQLDQTLYLLILLTPNYTAPVTEVWQRAVDSFEVTPVEPAAPPAPPTDTALPPAPKPTTKPTTAPPPPPAAKGCYLIENHLGVDLTITFTAQDWQWNDSFSVPASGNREYCLDPGRYTYTLDAPPPWGSTNGELQVQAGDRFLWPIRGE